MEKSKPIEVIGDYRIRYKGEVHIVPVDKDGNFHLPNGKKLILSEEQFSIVKNEIEKKKALENSTKPMMVPIAGEFNKIHTQETKEETQIYDMSVQEERPSAPYKNTISKQNKEADKKTKKAKRKVRDKEAGHQKEREEKKTSFSQTTKKTIIVTTLISVLVTVVIIAGLFLYYISYFNGLHIYDDITSSSTSRVYIEETMKFGGLIIKSF